MTMMPILRRALNRVGAWAAGLGLLGQVLAGGIVALPMLSVATPAQAICDNGNPVPGTYTYTAANIASAAAITLTLPAVSCADTTERTRICFGLYMASPNTLSGPSTITMTIQYYILSNNITTLVSGQPVFNYLGATYTAGANVIPQLYLRFNVAANGAVSKPAGTYTGNYTYQDELMVQGNTVSACTLPVSGASTATIARYNNVATFIVPVICTLVSTPTIAFGNISSMGPTTAALSNSGGVSVNCPSTTPYTIYLGDGGYRITGGNRQMANGTGRLPYQLYKEVGHTNVWDATGMGAGVTGGTGGVSLTGTGAAVVTTIYAAIPAATTLPTTLGAYSDSVVVTVAY